MNDDYPTRTCPKCLGTGRLPQCICHADVKVHGKFGISYSIKRNPKCRVNHNKYYAGKYQE